MTRITPTRSQASWCVGVFDYHYALTISPANRAVIPRELRRGFGANPAGRKILLVPLRTKDEHDYLAVYPEVTVELAETVKQQGHQVFEVQMDQRWGFVIPEAAITGSQLPREGLLMVGCGQYLEIWEHDQFDKWKNAADLTALYRRLKQGS